MKKKRTCDVDFEYFNGGSPRTLRKLYKKDTTLDCALLCYIFKNNGVIKK